MRIEIRTRNVSLDEESRLRVERRLRFALGRFAPELEEVRLRLDDVNGPRGGVDKRCRLTLHGPRFGVVTIEELRAEAAEAVDLAAGRAARAVARALERSREPVRTGASLARGASGVSADRRAPLEWVEPEL